MPAIPDTSDEDSEDDKAKHKAKNLSSGAQDKSGIEENLSHRQHSRGLKASMWPLEHVTP